jgi:3-dehydroquinate synthase
MIFDLNSSVNKYSLEICSDIDIKQIINYKNAVFLIDLNLLKYYPSLNNIKDPVLIKAVEKNKDLSNLKKIFVELKKRNLNKNSIIIALGGGIIQDIATFVASLYMRGVKWIYYPTTLLGMVDSCLGGKSSINLIPYKNLIGNFYPPIRIVVCTKFIQSLTMQDKVSGLIEAYKILYARNKSSIKPFLNAKIDFIDSKSILNLVSKSLLAKKYFIEIDEFDQNIRRNLNFGHTFGHVLESLSNYKIPHGVAVGYGILAAFIYESRNRSLTQFEKNFYKIIMNTVRGFNAQSQLVNLMKMKKNFFEIFDADKKHDSFNYCLILPDEKKQLKLKIIKKNILNKNKIWNAFHRAIDLYEI